jgi:septum formation protein
MKKIILASQSPWRKIILEKLGIPFDVVVSNFEEDMTQNMPPHRLAVHLARGKAETVAKQHTEAVVIAADTFIIFENELLGKPGTPERATEMLMKLAGKWHEIITGFVILDGETGKETEQLVSTRVHLRDAEESEIVAYVATGEPLNVAGGYAIQGRAGALVDRIEGDYWNIVGLPMSALVVELRKFGITPQ